MRRSQSARKEERSNDKPTLEEWQASDAVRAADSKLDMAIKNLRRRGLILYSKDDAYYDLHPIVRSVVDMRTQGDQRKEIGQNMIDHLTSIQRQPFEEANTLEDVQPGVDLVRMYQETEAFDDAADYFTQTIFSPLLRRFGALLHIERALIYFFPDGWFSTPHVSTVQRHVDLLDCVLIVTRYRDNRQTVNLTYKALELAYEAKLPKKFKNLIWSLSVFQHDAGKLAEHEALVDAFGRLEKAEHDAARFATKDYRRSALLLSGLYVGCVERGDDENALALFEELQGGDERVLSGKETNALLWHAIHKLNLDTLTHDELVSFVEVTDLHGGLNDKENLVRLRGNWHLKRKEYHEAAIWFGEAVGMKRRSGSPSTRDEAHRCLARLLDGQRFDAISQVETYEADELISFTCAKIWKELGECRRAEAAALRAHKITIHDGHPFVRVHNLKEIESFLNLLGSVPPKTGEHDPTLVRPYQWEAIVDKMLHQLEADRVDNEERRSQRKRARTSDEKVRPSSVPTTTLRAVKTRGYNGLLEEIHAQFEDNNGEASWPPGQ